MRWPWQPPPGMRRVSSDDLIGLLRDVLRASDLEVEQARLTRESSLLAAATRAHQLLEERRQERGVDVEPAVRDDVEAALPMTSEGRLHEEAFLALVDARVWAQREREVVAVMASGQFDVDGGDAR